MTRPSFDTDERGFALLGAVMFVIVLTILALTLFSLSSFESQFMKDSMDQADAYHAALGGLDRALFALTHGNTLASVKSGLPLDDVVYAVARQGSDTTDFVHWTGARATEVTVRVKAQRGSHARFLEAVFTPQSARSFYKNLATLSATDTGLYVYRQDWRDEVNPPEYNWKATYLSGVLVQNASNNPDFIYPLGAPPPTVTPLIVNIGGAPTPIVNSYIAQHANAPGTTNVPFQPGSNPYILNALNDPDSIAFFHTNEPGAWSLEVDVSNPRVNVSGTCLWLFDRGLRVSGTLHVQGSGAPSDMLVLVGGRQTADSEDPGAGLALLGSIYSTNVPVILVSDGNALVEHRDLGGTWVDDNNASVVNCLSIFASGARIMGPDANYDYSATAPKLVFAHPTYHLGNDIIDRLVEMGFLPNTQGAVKGKLTLIVGSFSEVTDTNPN